MGKITVKHYLNTNLKPYIVGEDKYYKIYVLLRANNKNTKLKSFVSEDEYTEDEFNCIQLDKEDVLNKYMQIETEVYTNIISTIEKDKRIFDIQVLNIYIQNYGKLLVRTLVEYLKWLKELEILKLEKRYNMSLEGKYSIKGHGIIEDSYWRSFSRVKYVIDILSEFISTLDCRINDDLFIYQWVKGNICKEFVVFYNQKIEEEQKRRKNAPDGEYYLYPDSYDSHVFDTPKECIEYVNAILIAIAERENTENLIIDACNDMITRYL